MSSPDLAARIRTVHELAERIREQVGTVIIGQQELVHRLLVALLCDGHVLLEGYPGLGKSLCVSTLARVLGLPFQRIQFTPDLLPADVIGTQIFHPGSAEFSVRPGPIFSHTVLADEINRAPPKVQSALLEAMQERQVTIGSETRALPAVFLVLATQNPIEQEGTYPLPEAELDRFLLHVRLSYPEREDEALILRRHGGMQPAALPEVVASEAQILAAREAVDAVHMDEKVLQYLLEIVRRTRQDSPALRLGASPRASLALYRTARAQALLAGRDYVVPRDVKSMAPDVLRHRVLLTFEAEAQQLSVDAVLAELLAQVEVP